MQRTRATLLVVVIALVASMLTLFARTPDASACSLAPPMLEVWPADALEPGQTIRVSGYGFSDVIFHPEDDALHSCAGMEIVPMEVVVNWIGERIEPLAVARGPEFSVEATVPRWAGPGPATIEANGFEVYVHVGGEEPCPIHLLDGTDRGFAPAPLPPECPDPCLGGPAVDVWCPEPCLGGPAVDVWCPEPCLGGPAVDVWCPEPCPPTILFDAASPDAVHTQPARIDCPEPCPLITVDWSEEVTSPRDPWAVSPAGCPEPCWGSADLRCPIPEPIPEPLPLPEPMPEPIPLPEPIPEPLPEPIPEPQPWPEPWPEPMPCFVQPDGTIICPAVAPMPVVAEPDVTVSSAPETAPTNGSTFTRATSVRAMPPAALPEARVVPAPPRPFIDFDGCRLDGADACG